MYFREAIKMVRQVSCQPVYLMIACKHNSLRVVKYLMDLKVDIDQKDKHGYTGFMIAVKSYAWSTVKYLKDNGANVILQNNFG